MLKAQLKEEMLFVLTFALWLQAGFWGLVSGSALIFGALIGYFSNAKEKYIAFIMSFGAGVLISALTFDLMDEAYHTGGFRASATGFLLGGLIYAAINQFLAAKGAKHRKRSQDQQPSEAEDAGSGLALAAGALLDGIPEAIAIGISMIEGNAVSMATVIAIFISNLPEGLSSSAGMKKAGRSKSFIFGVWAIICVLIAGGAILGYSVFARLPTQTTAATLALAAGAILCMLSETMIPEAFEKGHNWVGIICVVGFLMAFVLTKSL